MAAGVNWLDQKNYLLRVLMVILAFNYVERIALGLLMQDIKVDLQLSDTQMGVLTGIAFAFFYSVMGVPIARLADRGGNRVGIISVTTALCGIAVSLCGIAANFLQLMAIRVAVAIGEAGCMPTSQSLISDHFRRAERPRAMAIFGLGAPIALIIGYFAGGWLNEFYGWRITFAILGAPGIPLAAIAWFSLREPRRENVRVDLVSADIIEPKLPTLKETIAALSSSTTFRHLLIGYSVASFFGFGIAQWKAAFFIRSFGMQTGELGTWFAIIYGIGGLIGTYLGGVWAVRYAPSNEGLQLKVLGCVYAIFAFVSAAIYLSPSPLYAFAFTAVTAVGSGIFTGPLFATIQTLVPERMRATTISLMFLSTNFIGLGLGPVAAGALSDAFQPWAGDASLQYALLALCPGYLWCGWHVWRASQTVSRDVELTAKLGEASQ